MDVCAIDKLYQLVDDNEGIGLDLNIAFLDFVKQNVTK